MCFFKDNRHNKFVDTKVLEGLRLEIVSSWRIGQLYAPSSGRLVHCLKYETRLKDMLKE